MEGKPSFTGQRYLFEIVFTIDGEAYSTTALGRDAKDPYESYLDRLKRTGTYISQYCWVSSKPAGPLNDGNG